jgi:hypothetical protein
MESTGYVIICIYITFIYTHIYIYMNTQETLRHGQLGLAVPDWRRAVVELRAWVAGAGTIAL